MLSGKLIKATIRTFLPETHYYRRDNNSKTHLQHWGFSQEPLSNFILAHGLRFGESPTLFQWLVPVPEPRQSVKVRPALVGFNPTH